MRTVRRYAGIILVALGIAAADSQALIVPVIILAAGMLLLKGVLGNE